MSGTFPVGKVPAEVLERLLGRFTQYDPRVILGPRIGEDAAVIDMGDRYLVAKSDPITFATDEIGYYAVHVNANDILTHNALPRWFLATLLLPERQATEELAEGIMAQVAEACRSLEVALVGGHTEITYHLDRPIVCGQMLGEVEKERLITTAGLQEGDAIVLTKGVPLEGMSIIARERGQQLMRRGVPSEQVKQWRGYLHDPGISVMPEARVVRQTPGVSSMHDPTEGGVAMALWEMARAAGVGLQIERDAIPLVDGAAEACGAFGLDPYGTISSGALLIGVAAERVEELLSRLAACGVAAARIGRAVARAEGVSWRIKEHFEPLPRFASDEIAKLYLNNLTAAAT